MVRGICAALSWLNIEIRAFNPDNWRDALSYIEVTSEEQIEDVRRIAIALSRRVGGAPNSAQPFETSK